MERRQRRLRPGQAVMIGRLKRRSGNLAQRHPLEEAMREPEIGVAWPEYRAIDDQ
jgi:hypothetical protein